MSPRSRRSTPGSWSRSRRRSAGRAASVSTPCCSSSADWAISGWIPLPGGLDVLAHPYVLAASGFMFVVEFFADKIPGVDSMWDVVQTFIRIPAGAALAASVFGDATAAATLAAAILGGTLAAGSHFAKAGSRVVINTSPEPFSNWAASFGEDLAVGVVLWLAFDASDRGARSCSRCWSSLMIWLDPEGVRLIRRFLDRLVGRRGIAERRDRERRDERRAILLPMLAMVALTSSRWSCTSGAIAEMRAQRHSSAEGGDVGRRWRRRSRTRAPPTTSATCSRQPVLFYVAALDRSTLLQLDGRGLCRRSPGLYVACRVVHSVDPVHVPTA